MKFVIVVFLLSFSSCNNTKKEQDENAEISIKDSVLVNMDTLKKSMKLPTAAEEPHPFSNDRFRNVTLTKTAENESTAQGQARVFEASFNWVITDGHQEIDSGYCTTDAAAPKWGNFKLSVKVKKKEQVKVLHLILFEASAKDGSRQSKMAILLH